MSTTINGQVTRTIEIATPDELQELLGVHDAHLKMIVEAIPIRIVSRSGKMLITGEPSEVELASIVIDQMQIRTRINLSVDSDEVNRILKETLTVKFQQSPALVQTSQNIPDTIADHPQADEATWTEDSLEIESSPQISGSTQDLLLEQKPQTKPTDQTSGTSNEPKIKTCSPMSKQPRSRGQARYLKTIEENDLVFCAGPAGSGKTYLAVAMALHCLQKEIVRKIVLVRPAVEAGEKLGFLPGDMLAKVNPFLRPLLDALHDMIDHEQVQLYIEHDVIEIVPLAFMRGRTLNDTFMILDEAQNTTITQMKMFLTRMGTGSKIIVTGDETQNDLPAHVTSGLTDAMKRLKGIDGTASVRLDGRDIVRHRLVREIVKAYDEQGKYKK